MLIWLLQTLPALLGQFDGWQKITLRAGSAATVALLVALFFGGWIIRWLQAHFREPIVSDSVRLNELHKHKNSTPTMGGLFVVAAILIAGLLLGELTNGFLQVGLFLTAALAGLGMLDDLQKLRTGRRGVSARNKLLGQTVITLIASIMLFGVLREMPGALEFHLPLISITFHLGWMFIPLAMLVMIGSSNAVNLTDGLDGLAGGCLVFAITGMTLLAYVAGHANLAVYLHVTHIPGAGEIIILSGAMLGAVLGFLWFNCHPAQVFLGDTGSLPLGGLLGFVALVARQELLLIVIGGVFVAEAVSVLLQVGIFKWKKRRLFRCAPLHHHFQFLGWPESRIVVRFWITSALCTLLGLMLVKLESGSTEQVMAKDNLRANMHLAQPESAP